ncbi:hypothetical protein KAR91_02255 [Candidatus Pacearchaeota archaeon]|nr:hypothetical protein [Candidatus Pacearchaeota archaeon]
MTYEIRKIESGIRNSDNSKVYGFTKECKTFKELVIIMNHDDNDTFFYGSGCDIFRNGEIIADNNDFALLYNEVKDGLRKYTLKNLLGNRAYNS